MGNTPSYTNGAGSCVLFQPITLTVNGGTQCTYSTVRQSLYNELYRIGCHYNTDRELQWLTGTTNSNEAYRVVNDMCQSSKYQGFENFTSIDSRFEDDFMLEFISGKTFLNSK